MRAYKEIRGRDFDGSHCSDIATRLDAANRRRERADRGECINSSEHGEATHGIRCRRCFAVWRHGVSVVEARGLDALDLTVGRTQPCISHRGAA